MDKATLTQWAEKWEHMATTQAVAAKIAAERAEHAATMARRVRAEADAATLADATRGQS